MEERALSSEFHRFFGSSARHQRHQGHLFRKGGRRVKGWISIRENICETDLCQDVSDFLNDVSLMEFVIDVWKFECLFELLFGDLCEWLGLTCSKPFFLGMDVLSS